MEGLINNTQNILDACTIINLLHIDEDDFLLKKLKESKFNVCRKVFEETNKNVFNKFKGSFYYQSSEVKSKIKKELLEKKEQENYSVWLEKELLSGHVFKNEELITSINVYSRED